MSSVIGFLVGAIFGALFVVGPTYVYSEMPMVSIALAESACERANSTLVSLDRMTTTCANLAMIPYRK